ncbi:MAG: helix-turn-helix transcriptional regulator [Desulfobacterales bacterium]
MVPVIDEKKAADFLGWSVQTLRNRRTKREAPAYLKLGRSVRYRLEDLEDFVNQSRIDPKGR